MTHVWLHVCGAIYRPNTAISVSGRLISCPYVSEASPFGLLASCQCRAPEEGIKDRLIWHGDLASRLLSTKMNVVRHVDLQVEE